MKHFFTSRYFAIVSLLLTSGAVFAQNVGIGEPSPVQKLQIDGSAAGLQTIRVEDLATNQAGDFGQATGANVQTATTTSKGVYVDGSGDMTARYIYGDNMVSVKLPAGTQNFTGATPVTITNATLTLASPRHTKAYLSFAITGYNPISGTAGTHSSYVAIDVFQDGVKIGAFLGLSASSAGGSTGAATVTAANFPITTVIGTSTTIVLKGRTGGGGSGVKDFTVDNTNYTSYMTILD